MGIVVLPWPSVVSEVDVSNRPTFSIEFSCLRVGAVAPLLCTQLSVRTFGLRIRRRFTSPRSWQGTVRKSVTWFDLYRPSRFSRLIEHHVVDRCGSGDRDAPANPFRPRCITGLRYSNICLQRTKHSSRRSTPIWIRVGVGIVIGIPIPIEVPAAGGTHSHRVP
jgi:hypothetical protein